MSLMSRMSAISAVKVASWSTAPSANAARRIFIRAALCARIKVGSRMNNGSGCARSTPRWHVCEGSRKFKRRCITSETFPPREALEVRKKEEEEVHRSQSRNLGRPQSAKIAPASQLQARTAANLRESCRISMGRKIVIMKYLSSISIRLLRCNIQMYITFQSSGNVMQIRDLGSSMKIQSRICLHQSPTHLTKGPIYRSGLSERGNSSASSTSRPRKQ